MKKMLFAVFAALCFMVTFPVYASSAVYADAVTYHQHGVDYIHAISVTNQKQTNTNIYDNHDPVFNDTVAANASNFVKTVLITYYPGLAVASSKHFAILRDLYLNPSGPQYYC